MTTLSILVLVFSFAVILKGFHMVFSNNLKGGLVVIGGSCLYAASLTFSYSQGIF